MIAVGSAVMEQARVRRLGRDVLVNVVANLLTAALIYMVAVLAGVFVANRWLIGAAIYVIVASGVLWVSSYLGDRSERPGGDRYLVLMGAFAIAVLGAMLLLILWTG
jgi:hypothetical protein